MHSKASPFQESIQVDMDYLVTDFFKTIPAQGPLEIPPLRDLRPSSLGIVCRGLSGYFLLNWDGEGHWASPLASLRSQSPYSGVHQRVSDIFSVWL